ncbi:hypothetical protein DFA_10360 [Cavenderia fasciculata]|uniref:NADPH-dependent FMN reductase-like domain-containing protein n=1 Tax=Cavenderia fasciculata TaxID=261658 RepID=F4Q9Z9_CACFS|nr:uncharacterized protein DFA_10360 [Cavenderia fasciculata]EGG15518.1 hypothetical protein DFA_10360 [Cavenderia fasciculata]|eukprot:XP_004354260.1 hypothetical protein DFA_10360 [Cavenderia fasciculata]
MSKTIGLIIGSQRTARVGDSIAKWFAQTTKLGSNSHFKYEVVDLADHKLPMLDEPLPPMMLNGKYSSPVITKFSETIASKDGFIFVISEYNNSFPGNLKNAVDHLFGEWKGKPSVVASYGFFGGSSSNDQFTQVLNKSFLAMPVTNTRPKMTLNKTMFDEAGKFKDITTDFKPFEQSAIDSVKDLEQLLQDIETKKVVEQNAS